MYNSCAKLPSQPSAAQLHAKQAVPLQECPVWLPLFLVFSIFMVATWRTSLTLLG